ncbi:MAG: YceI family protein [Cytophagales bacterium]|nr:YceI family protein [Cytophagales bacterium]
MFNAVVVFCFSIFSFLPVDFGSDINLFTISKGQIKFTSNAPLELIEAETDELTGLIDPETKNFAFKVPIASFVGFNHSLQREHFNENYMESDKFPDGTFSGTIQDDLDFSVDGNYEGVSVSGKLSIHGITVSKELLADIKVEDGQIAISSNFLIPLKDHKIKIPKILSRKLATIIYVQVDASLIMR